MELFRNVVVGLALGFVVLSLGLQVVAHRRAAKLKGSPLPVLPGELGQRINQSPSALLYFFTPTCPACRPVTPRMKALADQGQPVFPIDATRSPELAMALSVMASPTTIEVQNGRVTGVHVGAISKDVWARFGA